VAKFVIDTSAKSRHLTKLTLIHVTNADRTCGNMKYIQPPPPSVTPPALLLELSDSTGLDLTRTVCMRCLIPSSLSSFTNNAHMLKVSSSRSLHPKEMVGQSQSTILCVATRNDTAVGAHFGRADQGPEMDPRSRSRLVERTAVGEGG
jgi:hypothetical protein